MKPAASGVHSVSETPSGGRLSRFIFAACPALCGDRRGCHERGNNASEDVMGHETSFIGGSVVDGKPGGRYAILL